ncbi:hypothetical protein GF369_00580 [Candidatus Peregrinibacteria bacterium]|nr:hypothetical protein [Candidatus Peregrinibacteria bacterium]
MNKVAFCAKMLGKYHYVYDMKLLGKIVFYCIIFGILAFLLVQLFFRAEYEDIKNTYFHSSASVETQTDNSLTIVYSFGVESLEPTLYDSASRSRTLNVYERLVATDRNLQAKSGLALSWGRIDEITWEFKLRPDVVFHDGSSFDANDVKASFDRAMQYERSGLKDILSTIDSVEVIDELTIHIVTKEPDPILVNRAATVLIFPSDYTAFDTPVGTAPYRFVSQTESEFSVTRFDDYWGEKPYYKNVFIKAIENRFDRIDAMKNGQIDILANVPPTLANEIVINQRATIASLPSLEVNFLMFNYESSLLEDKRIRRAISQAFDKDIFVDISNGHATASNQFVSNGIFGFNPSIEDVGQDLSMAKRLIRQYDPFKKPSVTIDMTQGTQAIGDYIKQQLDEVGLSVTINYLSFDRLRAKIFAKQSEMFYLGWRSEIGDASGFYENVVYSEGRFNGGNFKNKKVDQLIELSTKNLDDQKRLQQFQEIMRIIVEEEIMGVPLFETDVIYGVKAGVHFSPRLDGYILASELS